MTVNENRMSEVQTDMYSQTIFYTFRGNIFN